MQAKQNSICIKRQMKQMEPDKGIPRHILLMMAVLTIPLDNHKQNNIYNQDENIDFSTVVLDSDASDYVAWVTSLSAYSAGNMPRAVNGHTYITLKHASEATLKS